MWNIALEMSFRFAHNFQMDVSIESQVDDSAGSVRNKGKVAADTDTGQVILHLLLFMHFSYFHQERILNRCNWNGYVLITHAVRAMR